jgi:hypothetical protein
VGLPNETALEEPGPGQDHVGNLCPSPNIKQPRACCLTESAQMAAARTNPRGGATGSPSSVEKDGSRDKEDSKPSPLVTSSALIASSPDQEVVQEEAPYLNIPVGWKLVKLEPDW